jgi:hypothetical protein
MEVLPYSEDADGRRYDFGIRRIEPKEQLEILEQTRTIKFEGPICDSFRSEYSSRGKIKIEMQEKFKKNRVAGYCKSKNCKQNAVWSAPFGDNTKYHCIECLAKYICISRNKAIGPKIDIVFLEDNMMNYEDININHPDLRLKFTKQGVSINELEPVGYVYKFTDEYPICEIKNIPSGLKIAIIANQVYKGTIMGRHVCENIIFGRPCKSILEPTVDSFIAKTVPAGVPGWKEIYAPNNSIRGGHIVTAKYCYACSLESHRQNNSWSKSAEKNNSDVWFDKYKEKNIELDYIRKKIAENIKDSDAEAEFWKDQIKLISCAIVDLKFSSGYENLEKK